GRTRTRKLRFWRPLLCQIELLAYNGAPIITQGAPACIGLRPGLLGLPVERMVPAARAVLLQFETLRVVTSVLLRRVVSLSTLGAFQRDNAPDFFLCHTSTLNSRKARVVPVRPPAQSS